jgi:hypothetical protein
MHTKSREPRAGDGARLERAIVLQLLRDDREQNWSCAELATELGAEAPAIETALTRLHGEDVACVDGEQVRASRATRRLDELELISV